MLAVSAAVERRNGCCGIGEEKNLTQAGLEGRARRLSRGVALSQSSRMSDGGLSVKYIGEAVSGGANRMSKNLEAPFG